jgi:hypothetical protein
MKATLKKKRNILLKRKKEQAKQGPSAVKT